MSTLLARLDKKTGLKVLCGRPTCRGQLAAIRDEEGIGRHVVFGPGWIPKEGIWELSHRAKARIARGLPPANRRPKVTMLEGLGLPAELLEAVKTIGLPETNATKLPTLACCSACGFVSRLEAATLNARGEATGFPRDLEFRIIPTK